MQSLSAMMSLAGNLEKFEQQSKEAKRTKAIERAVNQAKGSLDGAAGILEQSGDWSTARSLRDGAGAIREQALSKMGERIAQHTDVYTRAPALLQEAEARPDVWPQIRPTLVEMAVSLDPRLAEEIPEAYDPARVRGITQFVERASLETAGLAKKLALADAFTKAQQHARVSDTEQRRFLGELLADATTEEAWETGTRHARFLGVADSLVEQAGAFSTDAPERLRKWALTAEQAGTEHGRTVDDERQAAAAKRTAEHQQFLEDLAEQREDRLSREERRGLTDSARAVAIRWRGDALDRLERDLADPRSELQPADVRRRQLAIENNYREQLNLPPVTSPTGKAAASRDRILPPDLRTGAARRPAGGVPASVGTLLKGQKVGDYELTDGTTWTVREDGSVQPTTR